MPRLGGTGTSSSPGRGRSHHSSHILQQWFGPSAPRINLRNVLLFLTAFFIVRNFLRNDYRREEIHYLRESGMSEEQIERYIPKTAEERKKYVQDKANDVEKMKKDIAYLLNEVAELKAGGVTNEHDSDERKEVLKSMDMVHERKRHDREEQLLKEHPDFKPGKRLKDMTEEELKAIK
mmetsp:Transcript_278/g.473  ORF Transcript_278/g.473 Transcript_278/m.473 type:complete len:178 (+) Transcript_278:134-667(+)|eukprot:CAMPEP_0178783972 /NCGR_PEP_ID=MMETSP0745-20121128/3988_1 /TAXON_ID=913974 /ORGANISM="Nitzschia punctata, Strain CCMP561" /LENGTH=177 /DNA_ID=CAMNT_0020441555 /DNA_START=27 /DNA_END=560 /DNA_ORIENTATION=+